MTAATRPAYPVELESWWLKTARQKTGAVTNTNALRALDAETAKLSDGFTTERAAGFGEYAANEKSLLAYGLFFFPQTFVRTLFQFDEIIHRCGWHAPEAGPIRIADLGAGTGAAGLALASRLAIGHDVELTAVEKSAESLALAADLAREQEMLWPRLKFVSRCASVTVPFEDSATKFDIIISSFAINEAFHDKPEIEFETWIERILASLSAGGLLLISEPAMKLAGERLANLRNRISKDGKMSVLAPCLHHRPCPMLATAGDNFCHEVRWWKPPASLQSLNSRLFRTIQFLKFSFIAIANAPQPAAEDSAELARLVSPMMDLKGRAQCDGCAGDGALRRYEVLTRIFETKEKQEFLRTERGDIVKWQDLSLLGDKKTHRAHGAKCSFGFKRS